MGTEDLTSALAPCRWVQFFGQHGKVSHSKQHVVPQWYFRCHHYNQYNQFNGEGNNQTPAEIVPDGGNPQLMNICQLVCLERKRETLKGEDQNGSVDYALNFVPVVQNGAHQKISFSSTFFSNHVRPPR